jgi:hypothetical protein
MTVALEMRVVRGQTVVAALVRDKIDSYHLHANMFIAGSRWPCAVLILRDGQIAAFTTAGETLAIDAAEALCPGVTKKMMAAVAP